MKKPTLYLKNLKIKANIPRHLKKMKKNHIAVSNYYFFT